MAAPFLTQCRLAEIVGRFESVRTAVIGDFFLDMYFYVDPGLAEISRETGKTANQIVDVRTSPGAAGNVALNLHSLGAKTVHAVGFIGDDGNGHELGTRLAEMGCITDGLTISADRRTPTYMKPRMYNIRGLAGEMERFDIKNHTPTNRETETAVIRTLSGLMRDIDAIVLVEQVEERACGVFTDYIKIELDRLARKHSRVIFFADSRLDVLRFDSMILKANQFELMGMSHVAPGTSLPRDYLTERMKTICTDRKAPLFVTLGEGGIMTVDSEPIVVPAVKATGEVDSTGAGDTATAALVLSLAAGATHVEAAIIANLAASLSIEQLDTCGVCRSDDLPECLDRYISQYSSKGQWK